MDVPVVASTDDLYFIDEPALTEQPKLYGLNRHTQKLLFEHCDAVIAISESVERSLDSVLSNTEIHVVHHGVDERYFTEDVTETDDFVLHASLASRRKNPDAIREVARRLEERVVIAGGDWGEQVPADLRDENVDVLGFVPLDELVELYHAASVFYFPTLHEGFGLPVLEAMAGGNAVVTSNVHSVPEVTGDAAVLTDPRDADAHVAAIRSLFADRDRRNRLAADARERAKTFTWADSAERTEAVYREVLDSPSR
jgi:glycosyltransferase involved in cell wall biosynthesis